MIDTHTHIYTEEFDSDRAAVVERARAAGVQRVVLANEDSASIERLQRTVNAFPIFAQRPWGCTPKASKPTTAPNSAA